MSTNAVQATRSPRSRPRRSSSSQVGRCPMSLSVCPSVASRSFFLLVSHVEESDLGVYECRASNKVSSQSSKAKLITTGRPLFRVCVRLCVCRKSEFNLLVSHVEESDLGVYECRASNKVSSQSFKAKLITTGRPLSRVCVCLSVCRKSELFILLVSRVEEGDLRWQCTSAVQPTN